MSAFWLLVVPVAGFAWVGINDVLRTVPKRNEDFVFC